MRRQDDGVRHGPGAVWDINAAIAVVFVIVGGERTARWDIGNRKGMGESRDVFVPVLLKSPAADAVAPQRRVVLPALGALPCILRDQMTHKVKYTTWKLSYTEKQADTNLCGDLYVGVIAQTLRVFIRLLLHLNERVQQSRWAGQSSNTTLSQH